MNIIPRVYNREFPLLLCEIWGRAYSSFFGIKTKTFPIYIFVLKNRLVDAYRNPETTIEINNIFLQKINEDEYFIKEFYNRVIIKFEELEEMWEREYLNKDELIEFYQKTIDFWEGMYASMYLYYTPKMFSKEVLDLMIKLRSRIDITGDEATHIIIRSLKKIYPKLGELILYVSFEDLLNGINEKQIRERASKKVIIVNGNIVSEEEFNKIKENYKFELERETFDSSIKEIKGQTAHKGLVKGIVRKLFRRSEVNLVMKGEVLVAPMTIPDFLPAMKKASAFVTDEGGITCHAAIVAREMKKPCIIGTKIATKILKDGDLVEVDANNGIVKILERENE